MFCTFYASACFGRARAKDLCLGQRKIVIKTFTSNEGWADYDVGCHKESNRQKKPKHFRSFVNFFFTTFCSWLVAPAIETGAFLNFKLINICVFIRVRRRHHLNYRLSGLYPLILIILRKMDQVTNHWRKPIWDLINSINEGGSKWFKWQKIGEKKSKFNSNHDTLLSYIFATNENVHTELVLTILTFNHLAMLITRSP